MRSAWGLAPVLLCQPVYAQGVIAVYPAPAHVVKGTTLSREVLIRAAPLAWFVAVREVR
jgi:hypothetical protein